MEQAGGVRVAFIYGSFASGTFGASSDIDLIVIGATDGGNLDDSLPEAESALGREIAYRLFSEQEWARQIEAKSSFLTEILAGPKLFVIGGADELEEVGRHR